MDFGSEFVYNYSDSEEEEISAEAIETGVDSVPEVAAPSLSGPARGARLGSIFVSSDDPPPRPPPPLPRKPTWKSASDSAQGTCSSKAGQRWRCADTNVVVVKFDRLTEPSNMHTGDPIVCSGCQVMLSHISKITQDGQKKIWTCEFCETKNEVEIVPEEMPSKEDVTYMLEPALVGAAGASGKTESQESIVVFCIDYSSSMETIVVGSGNSRITRLDGVKKAVCHQLERLADSSPGCRVAVVAFERNVKVIADGKDMREHRIRNEIFYDKTKLLEVASDFNLPSRISDSLKILTQNFRSKLTRCGTALGPGLLVSVGIARQMARSKVIICTDGEANEGLGRLDNQDAAYAFYTEVAEIAKKSGVSVSVLTISGTHCKLVELGRVADLTGGQVNIVDPQAATEEFGNILADAFIATHATARFCVHRDLYVRGEPDRPSHALRDIGNVIRGTEISFEYGVRRKKQPKTNDGCQDAKKGDGDDKEPVAEEPRSVPKYEPLIPENSVRLPFQVQIRYTDSKGANAVRVFSETKPITKDRKVAESRMNISILGSHSIRVSADKALNAQYMESRLTDCAYVNMFNRNAIKSERFKEELEIYEKASRPVRRNVMRAQMVEARSNNSTVMEAEKMLQNMGYEKVRRRRRQMVNDEFAEELYQGMKLSSTQFAKTAAKPPEEQHDQSKANDETSGPSS